MLKQQLRENLKIALKARETIKTSAIRQVLAVVKNAEIDKRDELTNEEIIKLLQKEARKGGKR